MGVKLFLKGEKCLSPKCPMVRKPYPPGEKGKRRTKAPSEYGKELKEKQKLRNWYNLKEKQFRKYVKEVLEARGRVGDADTLLIRALESRLDNVVFRLGFVPSRLLAGQLVSHRHILVNGRPVNVSSYQVRKGDKISIKPSSAKKNIFKNLPTILKRHKAPSWLRLNVEKLEGEVVAQPSLEEAAPPVEISAIFEFYSR
jgi:small subunit ribosomal protein S4